MKKIIKTIGLIVVSLIVLSAITFVMSRKAPGDPLVAYYGDRTSRMSTEQRQQAIHRLELDKPLPQQYLAWAKSSLKGDFGISYKYKEKVESVIAKRFLNTLILGGIGFGLTFFLALLLGRLCIRYEDSRLDRIICKVGIVTSCIPEFWMSLLFILVFSVMFRLLPSSGAFGLGEASDFGSRIRHMILPLAVLILSHLWYYAYLIRNRLAEEVRMDYVLLEKGIGLSRAQILNRHCIRNILPTFISLMAISLNHILEGTYIVEMVFSYPGLGTLSFESAKYHDYNMLMILVLITGTLVIIGNRIGQVISERIDSRMKWEVIRHES